MKVTKTKEYSVYDVNGENNTTPLAHYQSMFEFAAFSSSSSSASGAKGSASASAGAADTHGADPELLARITEQGKKVKEMKDKGEAADKINEQVNILLELKAKLPEGHPLRPADKQKGKDKPSQQPSGKPKPPKEDPSGSAAASSGDHEQTAEVGHRVPAGMRDYFPEDMAVREVVFSIIREVFKRHGGVEIDTPVMELKETLMNKYGEDTKLIYDIAGGKLALRYDLTVPFARFVADHGYDNIRRFHIARVYRRDLPAVSRGRYCEFYQCDWDAAGKFAPMVPDAECVKIAHEIMSALKLNDHLIKINHRKILDGIFEVCGVPMSLFRPICSAVDKLDKTEWPEVKQEMIVKGIDATTADNIWSFVQKRGGSELIDQLLQEERVKANKSMVDGLNDMKLLFEYLEIFNVPKDKVSFDLSLARGLDYYTGVIYECVLLNEFVGSVAGGGRYDNLVGSFKRNSNDIIPCVGVSMGIERLFTVVSQKMKADSKSELGFNYRKVPTDVLVVSGEREMLKERLRVCSELWAQGVRADTEHQPNQKFLTEVQRCESNKIPLCVVVGSSELATNTLKIRIVKNRAEETISRSDVARRIKELLNDPAVKM